MLSELTEYMRARRNPQVILKYCQGLRRGNHVRYTLPKRAPFKAFGDVVLLVNGAAIVRGPRFAENLEWHADDMRNSNSGHLHG